MIIFIFKFKNKDNHKQGHVKDEYVHHLKKMPLGSKYCLVKSNIDTPDESIHDE